MSGGFRDTFTKDEDKGLLGYDDAAFFYFASSVLVTIAVPWTYSFVKNTIFGSKEEEKDVPGKSKSGSESRQCQSSAMVAKSEQAKESTRRRNCSGCWWLQLIVLGLMWLSIYLTCTHLGQEEIKSFDPFKILEVAPSATAAEIKKAYRKLSLVYHPDKNQDDPLASARFIQITKAYSALTDETAKLNYEKYGNPDGPQTTKVGIGLPRFLLEKENQLVILSLFFLVLLVIIPALAICYYQRTKHYAENGVMIESLQLLEMYINESTRVKNCPELLAASAESRAMITRAEDQKSMEALKAQVVVHNKLKFNHPVIYRNSTLLLAHMQRLHHLMTPELRKDLDQLLKHSTKITQAMIEYSCMRDWFFTAQSMIEFRRSLVQALDVKSSQLLQIPHFDDDILRHCHRGKNAVSTLTDFLNRDPEQRKGVAKMEPQQLADVEAFASHISNMEIRVSVDVEDEEQIVFGDIATVTVGMHRKNLREGEAVGAVHAPFFPEAKFEEWWLFLVEAAPANRIITFLRVRDTDKEVEHKLRFQVMRPGKQKMEVHAMCDSYAGIDRKAELSFTALTEEESKREIFVHKEDEELDLQPTLFQQLMGDFGAEEESDEEEEHVAEEKQKAAKPTKKNKAESAQANADDEDKEEEDASTKGGKDGDDDDEDASSASSSDSD
mmetsp:Transcript_48419/g.123213  ORF Transcript_48419/g.123213 Transcript_48419/m.123213 type:complete len:668 (+) Transcript_48419:155-2158(+)